jgi:hypothetical protein
MLRALLHFGLSAVLVIAPALCCCNVRLLAGQFATCPSCPLPAAVPPAQSCCHAEKPTELLKNAGCCHETGPAPLDTKDTKSDRSKPAPAAPKPKPAHCDFCDERPNATLPKGAPSVAAPEPTGELVPLAVVGLADVSPEHLGLLAGLKPPERAGVDTRSEALFARHVLRC